MFKVLIWFLVFYLIFRLIKNIFSPAKVVSNGPAGPSETIHKNGQKIVVTHIPEEHKHHRHTKHSDGEYIDYKEI